MPGRSAERHLPRDGAEPAGTRRVHTRPAARGASGISGHDGLRETAGERQDVAVNRQHAGRRGGVRVSPPAAASPPGSCPRVGASPRTGLPLSRARAITIRWGASSFSPAVPPACHKQRSPAVSSGQSRSLEDGRWTGRRSLTCGGDGGRTCMACKGSSRVRLGSASMPLTTRPGWHRGSKPQGRRCRLHGLVHDLQELLGEGVEVDLLA
jgi:hypothetical protein